jgi:hypothetical protein
MLIMKWKTDNEGRLVAAWEETRRSRTTIPCTCLTHTPPKANTRSPTSRLGFFSGPRSRAAKVAGVFIAKFLLLCRLAAVSDCALGKLNLNSNRNGLPSLNVALFVANELESAGTCGSVCSAIC